LITYLFRSLEFNNNTSSHWCHMPENILR